MGGLDTLAPAIYPNQCVEDDEPLTSDDWDRLRQHVALESSSIKICGFIPVKSTYLGAILSAGLSL